jgi:hypothetical protein
MPDRGVSEVLGYVGVFALVLTSIAFVTVAGVGSLEDVRDAEQASNAERAFDVVADNMESVYARNSPSRATEIDLGDSELFFGSQVSIEIEVGPERFEHRLRPVVLRPSDETELVYEGGAVFRTDGDSGTMLDKPPFLFSADRVHAPIVKTTSQSVEAAGATTVLLRGQSVQRDILLSETGGAFAGDDLNVTVSSPRYEVWERYFEEETALSGCTTDDSTETVECSMTSPDVVYVTLQEIEMSIVL